MIPFQGIRFNFEKFDFEYSENVFAPEAEQRRLGDIQASLKEPNCNGPDIVYSIAMDIGLKEDRRDLVDRNLLYGEVLYAKGLLGKELVRSQGHTHSVSASCKSSTPEVYEIHHGNAVIYMQESLKGSPGLCYAVEAGEGDVVIVPPYWAHMTVNININEHLAFGAWCVRDYGFEYTGVREKKGLAWFPIYQDGIKWLANPNYSQSELICKKPRQYSDFNLSNEPIYRQYRADRNKFNFVCKPAIHNWESFVP